MSACMGSLWNAPGSASPCSWVQYVHVPGCCAHPVIVCLDMEREAGCFVCGKAGSILRWLCSCWDEGSIVSLCQPRWHLHQGGKAVAFVASVKWNKMLLQVGGSGDHFADVSSLKMASLKIYMEWSKWIFLLKEGLVPLLGVGFPPPAKIQAECCALKGRSLKTKQKAAVNLIQAPW